MENMMHEQKFIELLGFKIIKTDKKDYYKIIDESKEEIGFIERKMIHKSVNDKITGKILPAIFGYHMKIDSKHIHYDSVREFNNRLDKYFDVYDTSFYYEFSIENNDCVSYIKLSLGEKIRLVIKSSKYGYMEFNLDKESLYLSLKNKTDKLNILETILTKVDLNDRNAYKGLEHTYNITYCDKNSSLNKRIGRKTSECFVKKIKNDSYQDIVSIRVNNWLDGNIIESRERCEEVSVSDFLKKDLKGIEVFNRFRNLIKEIIPVDKDILFELLKMSKVFIPIFMPDNKHLDFAKFDEVYNISDDVKLAIKIIGRRDFYYIANAYVIYNDLEIYDFSKPINMKSKEMGYFSWNQDYIYKLNYDGKVLDCFDIKGKENITNKDKMKSI